MSKTVVVAAKAPNPMPHIFPQAVIANGQVFCSGNIAMDESCRIIPGDIKAHTVSFSTLVYPEAHDPEIV